jgi:hypothetical protein
MLASGIVAAVGLVFLGIGIWLVRKLQASRRWPWVDGVVTGSRVVRRVSQGTGDDESESISYVPTIEYRYELNGQHYSGSRIAFAERGYGSHGGAERSLAKYPLGGAVKVMYDPAKPGSAVLECRNPLAWVMLTVGIVILAVAVVLGVVL